MRRIDPVELQGPQPRPIDYVWAVPFFLLAVIPLSIAAEVADFFWGPPR